MRNQLIFLIKSTLLLMLILSGCNSNAPQGGEEEMAQLNGFWRNDSGLYYLNILENEPISFVLPNTSATLSQQTVATLTPKGLHFVDGKASFLIPINDMPPRFGNKKCLEADNTRLCKAYKR